MQTEGSTLNVAEHTQNKPTTRLSRVVIVGAGFGGLQAARALHNAPVRVTVIDRNNHHLFQPLLYWVATAGLSPADICAPIRHVLKKHKNAEVLMDEVTGVNVQEQHVLLHDRTIPYDYLILATGARDNYFGHDNWEHFAPGMKSVVDALTIRRRILLAFETAELETDPEHIKELLTFVLVGAGPTGVEMAGAIAEIAHKTLASDFRHIDPKLTRILLIEAGPRILITFPESLSHKSEQKLTRMNVEVRTGTAVSEIDEHGVVVAGEHIAAKTVIWTAGVKASPAGQWLGAEVDRGGRVKVLDDLTIPGHPNIFVIGDTATLNQNGKPLPGVAQVAIQQGRYAASTIAQRVAGKQHKQPFHYRDRGNLATIGRSYAIADIGPIKLTGLIGWVVWLAVHLFFLIGFRNRYVAFFQWAWTYFTFERGARVLTFEDKDRLQQNL